jgi:hypothetical protein
MDHHQWSEFRTDLFAASDLFAPVADLFFE